MSAMQSVGKYQLLRELGKGASGKVYLAEDPFNKPKVAIEVAFPDALTHSEDVAFYKSMFLNEAPLAGRRNHPPTTPISRAASEATHSTSAPFGGAR